MHDVIDFIIAKSPMALVLAVMVSTIAYISSARWKIFVFSVPIPFTCAYLATDIAINATHVAGLLLSSGYHWLIYLAVGRARVPLAAAIPIGAMLYVGAASSLIYVSESSALGPIDAWPIGAMLAVGIAYWLVMFRLFQPRHDGAHRSYAPWWVKGPLIYILALVIYSLTGLLGGAVTTFPYAGVFTSYEMRKSLRTLAGQYSLNLVAFMAMLGAMWVTERYLLPEAWRHAAILVGLPTSVGTLALLYAAGLGRPMGQAPAPAAESTAA